MADPGVLDPRLDPRLADRLRAYELRALQAARDLGNLGVALDALEADGIRVLPLKGVDLLGRAYGGALGVRPMQDADLLYRREDRARLEAVFLRLGYEPFRNGNLSFRSVAQGLCIDLFPQLAFLRDTASVWNRTVLRVVAGRLRETLHPRDALLYLVAYQTLHRGRLDPRFADDVAALIRAESAALGWGRFVREARRNGIALPVRHGLSYAVRRAGAQVPARVLEALRDRSASRWSAGLYRRMVREHAAPLPKIGILLRLAWAPGPAGRWRVLLDTLFPSGEFLGDRYGQQGMLPALWNRLTRPLVLTWRGALLLVRIVPLAMRSPSASRG